MKYLFFIILFYLVGCQKEYQCTITTTYNGNSTVNYYTLKGKKEDKEKFEENGTTSNPSLGIYQTTICE